MNMKTIWRAVRLSVASLVCVMTACSPESASNEKENKLHEDPIRAVFTLQEGTLNSADKFDKQPHIADFKPSAEPAQVVEWQTTEGQAWHVTSQSSGFKVKNTADNPDVVYRLKMEYYNADGELMNSQFYTNGQDKIHQHFFSMYKEVSVNGQKGSVRVTKKEELPYDYRYADELNGNYVAETNPMGFDGFLRFTQSGARFNLSVDLLHAAQSKFDANGKPSPFYLPAKSLLSTGQWDINVKLPIEVEGIMSPRPINEQKKMPFAPKKVQIEIYNGHIHDVRTFHQNPYPAQNHYIGKNYKIEYTMVNGKWEASAGNPEQVNLIGSKSGSGAAAFVIRYFDEDNNDITREIVENGANAHYQHFFTVSDIKPGYGGVSEPTDKNGKDFFAYEYCDTDPWNHTHKFQHAPFVGDKDPIGIKGFFRFFKSHKKFNLQVKLMYASDSKMVGGKPSPFYQPTPEQLMNEAWLPNIVVPINVYIDADELGLEQGLEELVESEEEYSKEDQTIVRSLMDAFGIKDFKEAIADFYWNFNGERTEDETGFWF